MQAFFPEGGIKFVTNEIYSYIRKRNINKPTILYSLEHKHVLSLMFVFLLQFSSCSLQKNDALLYMKPSQYKMANCKN